MLLDVIKTRCEEKGITIAELERKAKIGNGVVGRWDKMNPRLSTLFAVASVLEIPAEELLKEAQDGTTTD